MLVGYPSKNGTGISIFGDYADLKMMYKCVHRIAECVDEEKNKGQHQLLMNFAYEIRKGFSGNRLEDKIKHEDGKELQYYGFQLIWPDILLFISALRHNAGYIQTDKSMQATLYMLEYITEEAQLQYDVEGAIAIHKYVENRINIANPYVFLIFQAIHIDFLRLPPGKKRFRQISQLFMDYNDQRSLAYNKLLKSLEKWAIERKCDILDLELLADDVEIEW